MSNFYFVRSSCRIGAVCAALVWSMPVLGADDAKESDPAAPPPSLDELLGIDSDAQAAPPEGRIAEREAAEELRRRLAAEDLGDAFRQAIRLMELVVARFDDALDTGIETQRAQDDVIARLESLIEQARQQQSEQSSSSSSSPQRSQSQRQQQPSARSSEGASSASESDSECAGDGDQDSSGVSSREGDLRVDFEESRAEWGALPDRVRNMLLQGRRERFSSLYEQLTREYYRRLAEE